jgi:RimJ/RimL family protein N-acetyltransferase
MTSDPRPELHPDWPLETERLLLRPFEIGDLEAFHAIHSDEGVARYLYNDPRTVEGSKDLLERKVASAALRAEGDWLSAAVVLRETGDLVGDVDLLWASEQHRQGEIGFIFHPAHHGSGYATEAARPLLGIRVRPARTPPSRRPHRGSQHGLGTRAREAGDAARGALHRERMGQRRVAE